MGTLEVHKHIQKWKCQDWQESCRPSSPETRLAACGFALPLFVSPSLLFVPSPPPPHDYHLPFFRFCRATYIRTTVAATLHGRAEESVVSSTLQVRVYRVSLKKAMEKEKKKKKKTKGERNNCRSGMFLFFFTVVDQVGENGKFLVVQFFNISKLFFFESDEEK